MLLGKVFRPTQNLSRGAKPSDSWRCRHITLLPRTGPCARGPQGSAERPISLPPSLLLSSLPEQQDFWPNSNSGRTQVGCCAVNSRSCSQPVAQDFMATFNQVPWYPKIFPHEGDVFRPLVLMKDPLSATWLEAQPSLGGVVLTGQSSAPGASVKGCDRGVPLSVYRQECDRSV